LRSEDGVDVSTNRRDQTVDARPDVVAKPLELTRALVEDAVHLPILLGGQR
jgi:hypothetical protein